MCATISIPENGGTSTLNSIKDADPTSSSPAEDWSGNMDSKRIVGIDII